MNTKHTSRPIYFVRCRRGNETEDYGRDYAEEGILWTLEQCQRWIRNNTVEGKLASTDGGDSFDVEIMEWA